MQLTHVDQSHWDFRSIGAAHGQMGIFTAIWFFSRPYGVFHGHVFFFTAILGCHGHMLKRLMAGEEAIKQPSRLRGLPDGNRNLSFATVLGDQHHVFTERVDREKMKFAFRYSFGRSTPRFL